jgi:hypothetical protein
MAQRSRYPAIPLPEAVNRLEKIYEKEGPSAMSSAVAVQHMGYSGLNGASLTALAALKKYGLLEGRAEDLKISKEGVVIVSDKNATNQSERATAIRSAFLSDPLFQELDERFKGKTTDINVISYLQKRGFAPAAARSAARSYMESSTFADQEGAPIEGVRGTPTEPLVETSEGSGGNRQPDQAASQVFSIKGNMHEAPIVMAGVSSWPTIRLPKQFSLKNWTDMMRILDAMKDGFITKESDE